jgi:hypothetical protein
MRRPKRGRVLSHSTMSRLVGSRVSTKRLVSFGIAASVKGQGSARVAGGGNDPYTPVIANEGL